MVHKRVLKRLLNAMPTVFKLSEKSIPPFQRPVQSKRCKSGNVLSLEILHFSFQNHVLRTKFNVEAKFHFHICLHFEVMAI